MSKSRLFNILAMLIAAFMLIALAAPKTAVARPTAVATTYSGAAVAPDTFFVSGVLKNMASAPTRDTEPRGAVTTDPGFGPYREAGSLQIPRKIVTPATLSNFHGGPAPRVIGSSKAGLPAPDKKVFDDPMPGIDGWWNALNQGGNRTAFGYGVYPPDTNGDASDTHYIQMVNSLFAIWDLTTFSPQGMYPKPLFGPARLSDLWYGSNDGVCDTWDDGDPIVLYDEGLDVWMMSQFALPNYGVANGPYYECIAVSQTSDPLGKWNLYRYSFDVMNDYPHFGVWGDGYYMTINQFDPADAAGFGSAWRGQGVAVFERAKMSDSDRTIASTARMIYIDTYPANPATACANADPALNDPGCYLGGMLSSHLSGLAPVAGTPNFFMQFDDDAWGYSPDQLQLWKFVTDWTAGTADFTHVANLPVDSFDSEVCSGYARNCIPQPHTAYGYPGLDAIADRLMYRLQFRSFAANTPVVGENAHFTLVVNHTVDVNADPAMNDGTAGIRWYEIRSEDGGATWGVHQQGTLAPNDGLSRWMGSAAMDEMGNIALGYSISGYGLYPSIAYTGRQYSDPLGTMRDEKPIYMGAGSQLGVASRWGDYSTMSVAPDGCQMYYTTEAYRSTVAVEWYTVVGTFSFPACQNGDVVSPTGTNITAQPTDPSHSPNATFAYTNPDAAGDLAGFVCSLDGGDWEDCSAGNTISYAGLSTGSHTFAVRAYDDSDNFESTPATYTWTVSYLTRKVLSAAALDGFVLEKAANTGLGYSVNTTGMLVVGDHASKRQYRSFLSFNTSTLPDNAVVVRARVYMKQRLVVGTPFSGLGNLTLDIKKGVFGTTASLVATDFQALPSVAGVGVFDGPTASWFVADLDPTAFAYVNTMGATQFRVYFSTPNDNDLVSDYLALYGGETLVNAPYVVIDYYVP